jgi:hypothetical protein
VSICVVVLGLRRSGTSITARLLEGLGAFMGEQSLPTLPHWHEDGFVEDAEFVRALDGVIGAAGRVNDGRVAEWKDGTGPARLAALRQLCAERAARFDLWGCKNFALSTLLPEFVAQCPCPVRVVLLRREFAAAVASLTRCNGQGFEANLLSQAHQLVNLDMSVRWARRQGLPVHEISYDGLVESAAAHVADLAGFLGVADSPELAGAVREECRRF